MKYGLKLQKIGELLKEHRKARGLEYSQISEIIKIRGEYLKALENSDYTVFPSEVQAKGFLKKYARFLNIEEDKALALYRRERETTNDQNIIKSSSNLQKGSSFILTPGKLVAALVIGTILAVLIYIGTQIQEVVKPPELTVTSPAEIAAGEEETLTINSEELTIGGKIQVGARLKLNGTEVVTNNLETYQIPNLKLKDGENKFVLIAENQFGRETQIVLNVIKEATTASQMYVVIVPQEDLSLSIVADNEEVLNANVKSGEKAEFPANETFTLKSSKLDKLTITINGVLQESISGSMASWEFVDGQVNRL